MDKGEIRSLLGETIYNRAKSYENAVGQIEHSLSEEGVCHISAQVNGSGRKKYDTQVWLRKNGTFISASCSCPYNENGEGRYCKHIGALLLAEESRKSAMPQKISPKDIPGILRGSQLRRAQEEQNSSYEAGVKLIFGSKWHEKEPESDRDVCTLLRTYRENTIEKDALAPEQRTGFVHIKMELTLIDHYQPCLRLWVSDGGRYYVVKSIPELVEHTENGESYSYGKSLAFVHKWDAYDSDAQQILQLMRRQVHAGENMGIDALRQRGYGYVPGPAGSMALTGEVFDRLVELCLPAGMIGEYTIQQGKPKIKLDVSRCRGGANIKAEPVLGFVQGLDYGYAFSKNTLWRLPQQEAAQLSPVLRTLCGKALFFNMSDVAAFCSYVLPELGKQVEINDPERLVLNRIPLEPVVQFYLDAPDRMTVKGHVEFLYGEDRVAPGEPVPMDVMRDQRTEQRMRWLMGAYMQPNEEDGRQTFYAANEDDIFALMEDGVPRMMEEGEVYLTDAFRNLQAQPPKITVGVSVHGSVLDLDVDTGEFPLEELRELLGALHQKKRYHRLRDGRLLRLDESLDGLDELSETLELADAKLTAGHTELPLYRAPTLDWAMSEQNGVIFNRDEAFRKISRSFHAVRDSEYTPPESLHHVLRKYQRDGYRWLRTLDGYGMGGILADDMGLGKTLQVLSYLLAMKEAGQNLPSLIVCPASLVLNWEEECKKFTPQLHSIAVDGTAARRAELAQQWTQADLVITSYDLLRRDEKLYEEQNFYACILDEAQAIKNHTTQKYKAVCRIQSKVRFALTGTPVENRLAELWSIFSFLMPGYLPHYKTFCERFEKPIVQEDDKNAVRRLNQLTQPFILRRMKTDVLKELPPKTENIHRIEMEQKQRKLYLSAVIDARERLRAAKPEDKMAVFAVLMRLREICCDPSLVAEKWDGGSAKLDACMELVSSAVEGGHRILLFSQFTSMLDILAKRLEQENISHFTLQGSTPKAVRAELVRRFNNGEASVFLISLRAGGTGLNLTAADIVIHYDPWWNVAAQNQATDRAYRIGQKNPVQVYKLITQDTIEEKIVELQQAKQSLAETVTGAADGAILSMKPEELLQLLEASE